MKALKPNCSISVQLVVVTWLLIHLKLGSCMLRYASAPRMRYSTSVWRPVLFLESKATNHNESFRRGVVPGTRRLNKERRGTPLNLPQTKTHLFFTKLLFLEFSVYWDKGKCMRTGLWHVLAGLAGTLLFCFWNSKFVERVLCLLFLSFCSLGWLVVVGFILILNNNGCARGACRGTECGSQGNYKLFTVLLFSSFIQSDVRSFVCSFAGKAQRL